MRPIAIFLISASVCLGQLVPSNPLPIAALAWDASPSPEVTGYWIYYGMSSGIYTSKMPAGNTNSFAVPDLMQGQTYYFAATASIENTESVFSNEVSYTVPVRPLPPTLHPVVALTIQSKVLGASAWIDMPTGLTAASQTNQMFRLKIAVAPPPIPAVKQKLTTQKILSPKHTL